MEEVIRSIPIGSPIIPTPYGLAKISRIHIRGQSVDCGRVTSNPELTNEKPSSPDERSLTTFSSIDSSIANDRHDSRAIHSSISRSVDSAGIDRLTTLLISVR